MHTKTFHAGREVDLRGIVYQIAKTEINKFTFKAVDDGDDNYHEQAVERLNLPNQIWVDGHGLFIETVKIELVARPINPDEWDGPPTKVRESQELPLFAHASGKLNGSDLHSVIAGVEEAMNGVSEWP